ncbi:response regulator transcription factor [Gemmatimonadota bacterium]
MAGPDATMSKRGRILVAEDEPHIRRVLATLLQSADFEVVEVVDGDQAHDLLAGPTPFDFAVMDIMMPGRTGIQVLKEIIVLDHRADLPVLILTAKGQDTDRDEAFASGAVDFMTKPFSPKRLLSRINEILESP